MLAAVHSLAFGTVLALGAVAPKPEPVEVTLVAAEADADAAAAMLAPRLAQAGYEPSFRRCDDFSCVHDPTPERGPEVIVVLSEEADALVIVVQGNPTEVVVDEVELSVPRTGMDAEALGFAVTRALLEPPPQLRTPWSVAEREGLDRAPPAPTPVVERLPPAFGRGAYLEVSLGTTSLVSGGLALGLANAIEGGALVGVSDRSRFRVGLGVRASNATTLGREGLGIFAAQARVALGLSTARVLALMHVGGGPGVLYGGRFIQPDLLGVVSVSTSLRGRVTERVAVGVEAGWTAAFPWIPVQLQALGNVTITWGVPKRRKEARP